MGEFSSPSGNPIQVILEHGGIAAYLIIASGGILAILGLERIWTLYFKLSFNTSGAIDKIRALIINKRYTDALQVCNQQEQAPSLAVVKAGLLAVENGREAMRSSVGEALLNVQLKCEKHISYLALIANVATLLGLFGTILGLIKTFAAISKADPSQKGELLGIGISEAMYATAAGLFVGITAMVVHTMCVTKSDDIVGAAQDAGLKLMTWVEQSERSPHAKHDI